MYFEDYRPDLVIETDSHTLTEAEIIQFGITYAPLPYHTDPEAAKKTAFGGLVATGYQTLAIAFRLIVGTGMLSTSRGSPGLDRVRWIRPVRPGDTIRVKIEVVSLSPRVETGKDANGVRMRYTTINQNDEAVMAVESFHYIEDRVEEG